MTGTREKRRKEGTYDGRRVWEWLGGLGERNSYGYSRLSQSLPKTLPLLNALFS